MASGDVLSADMVGAKVLGHEISEVPHLKNAARNRKRPVDLSDLEVVGEKIESVAFHHKYTFPYNEDETLPLPMAKMGIAGLSYRKYDDTMCTYCSSMNRVILGAIAMAWKGEPWDEVEVLTGKRMEPTPGKNKTVLLGKCMYQLHKENPVIKEMIAVKSCPPQPKAIVKAFHLAGIGIDPAIIENAEMSPGFFMKRYEGKPEYEEDHFRIT